MRDGLGGLGRITTCAVLHFDGCQLLYVDELDPSVISHMSSEDCIQWHHADPVAVAPALTDGVIESIQLHQYGVDVILGVTVASELILLVTRTLMAGVCWVELPIAPPGLRGSPTPSTRPR